MKRYINLFVPLAFILAISIYFRAFTVNFPQFKIQAKNIIEQNISQLAVEQVDDKFPGFSGLAKDRLIKTLIHDYKIQKRQEIRKQIQEEYLKLKGKYQDDKGQTYLLELDCWHWARYVENVLRNGHPGDKIVNGQPYDTLMLAPEGSALNWNTFLFHLSAFLYKCFYILKPIPLFTFLFYLPLFFTSIFLIALYLFCFFLMGNPGATIGCLFVGLAPTLLLRSCAGWFDMDLLNLLFPLLVIWSYFMAYKVPDFKQRLLWICFSGFWVGLFCFTWLGWWFIFLIVILYEAYSLLNLLSVYCQYKVKNTPLLKQHVTSLLLFISFSIFWIVIFVGTRPLGFLYEQVTTAINLNRPLTAAIWPNVRYTVAELKRADLLEIADLTGGVYLFLFSSICVLVVFLRNRNYADFKYGVTAMFTIWFMAMLFACFKGIRFTNFVIIPLGIFLGMAIEEAYQYFKKKKKKLLVFLVLALAVMLSVKFVKGAYRMVVKIGPFVNDNLHDTLINLKKTTEPDAIITSWWDFGDWFKTIANRRVTFDGQSQNDPRAYWVAKVLINNDESQALGILRMLDNGGNSAFEIVDSYIKDPFKSVSLLERIIFSKSPREGQEILSKFLPSAASGKVIRLIFAKPPSKAYFIVDSTMPNKMPTISYLGNWNFTRVYLMQNIDRKGEKQLIKDGLKEFGMGEKESRSLYQEASLIAKNDLDEWISQRLSFRSSLVKGQKKNDAIYFENGFVYNPKEQTVYLYSCQDLRYKVPKSLFILENSEIKEVLYPKNDLDFSILVFKIKEEYHAVLLDRQLANSLFVRLFFLDGLGLKHFRFRPFKDAKYVDEYMKVFEITWD